MANLIGLMGSSGTGKSTSLRTLDPNETVIINVSNKPLPFKTAKQYVDGIKEGKNYSTADNAKVVKAIIEYVDKQRPEIKNLVVDDAGYLMGFEVMRRSEEKGYEKWTDFAKQMFSVVDTARQGRNDLNVIFTFHTEKADEGSIKIKTAGKLLDNAIYLDGLFTFLLVSKADLDLTSNKVEYKFVTQNDGYTTAKSPIDCLEMYEPNDMQLILDKIKNYYK